MKMMMKKTENDMNIHKYHNLILNCTNQLLNRFSNDNISNIEIYKIFQTRIIMTGFIGCIQST